MEDTRVLITAVVFSIFSKTFVANGTAMFEEKSGKQRRYSKRVNEDHENGEGPHGVTRLRAAADRIVGPK